MHALARLLFVFACALASTALAAGPPARTNAARGIDRAKLQAALAIQRHHADALLQRPGVVGVGVGIDRDGEAFLRVLTSERGVPRIPAQLDGLPVRIRVSGRIHALRGASCETSGDGVCEVHERWPLPVPVGVSIGHPAITAGTLGARVTDGVDVFALSNNHVLANSNLASVGDDALQPGSFDGGSQAAGDAIGSLHDFAPIAFCDVILIFVFCTVDNYFDAAIALSSPAQLGFATPSGEFGSVVGYGAPNTLLHPSYGVPTTLGDEDLGQLQQIDVQKVGRTTGLTHGSIDTIQLTVDVCYDASCTLVARFADQLAVSGSFSAGGDSGSLVVTDDAARYPVGLLFAGSANETIVNRIDRVLTHFGVSIDDGGSGGPISDASLQSLAPPSFAVVNVATAVTATVRNGGTTSLPAFDIAFSDDTEGTSTTMLVPALASGAQTQVVIPWTPTQLGAHTLSAALQISDDDPANNQGSASISVLLTPPGLTLRTWTGDVRTDAWTQVVLNADYGNDMVVVCTPQYDVNGLGPLVARVRNAVGNHFDVGLGRPWFGAFPGEETSERVNCLVVRAGVYDNPGFRLEAVRLDGFSAKDDETSWVGQARSYAQPYTQPVVVGQVISQGSSGLPGDLGVWSMFWARGATSFDPPSAGQLFVGRHTGTDPGARSPETLAYLVVEAGTGTMNGTAYVAALGAETIRGVEDAPPYNYSLPSFLTGATAAVASSAGMDGIEGGWPILYGAAAVSPTALGLAIEEDWYFDSERNHTTENVGYMVFGFRIGGGSVCGLGIELTLLLPLLAGLRRRVRPHSSTD